MKRLFTCLLTLSLLLAALPALATFSVSLSNIAVKTGEEVAVWYNLPESGLTSLTLIDKNGQPVAVLFSEQQESGFHEYFWDGTAQGKAFPSGSYDLELRLGDNAIRLKLILDTPAELVTAEPEPAAASTGLPEATEAPTAEPQTAKPEAFNPTPALRSQ